MANFLDMLQTHKVLELQNSVGRRTGHMAAQHILRASNFFTAVPADANDRYIDNGRILYLNDDGELAAAEHLTTATLKTGTPMLHFTEELITGPVEELKYFTVYFEDTDGTAANDICYPRMIALYTVDTFVTDNYAIAAGDEDTAVYGYVGLQGELQIDTALPGLGYVGPLFRVEKTTLPNDEDTGMLFEVLHTAYEGV